ncbi:cupin domain-containing protein [Sphingobium sufflavum]|uniref:cupin domain-containing protein n=1 Tax=Sphingobium sufflavum TaxID=1129547 RepID=UPI001F2029B4|nr:cupin domain-containing protein [Sphingobium sufflavum]MCE7796758.1 cupin domain-containing protein [Sphingobium sufflavum]
MIVVDERATMRREPPPHGAIGMSTAYRISDAVPAPRAMEFRRRILDRGAAIGEHPIAHDEVYHVLDGEGEVVSDGQRATLRKGMTAYLYKGAVVGISQRGRRPLSLIVAYPNTQ